MNIHIFALFGIVITWQAYGQADVDTAIARVAKHLDDQAIIKEEAEKLALTNETRALLDDLLLVSQDPKDHSTSSAAIRLILKLDPFPYEDLARRLTNETDSYKIADLIWLMDRGSRIDAEIQSVISEAKKFLGDERPGFRIYGPPSEYGSFGLRLCDVAYNILVQRLKLNDKLAPIDVANTTYNKRNRNLNELISTLGLQIPKRKIINISEIEAAMLKAELKKPNSLKDATHIMAVPQPSPSWLVWQLVVIAVTVSAVWVFLRKSK